jgi:hypothetical protein
MLTLFQHHLLPSLGPSGTYIKTWDRIYKARKAVASFVLKEYEVRDGKKTRVGRGKKQTSTAGRKELLDKMARKLSPVILNTVKKHGLAVNIPFIWSEACPILYKQVRGGDKGENLDCLIELLLEMIVSTHPRASSLKYGTAWQSVKSQATLLDLDDSKLFAYENEDMDLAKILSLLLKRGDFSSDLNSILDAKNTARQTAISTGKKKKVSEKHNDLISEEDRSSSGSEEDHTTTLAMLPQRQSKKKTDTVKKYASKFIEDTAGTDGGGHESEHVDSAKWEDLGLFFEEKSFNTALHHSGIQKCEKIDERVMEFIQYLSNDLKNTMDIWKTDLEEQKAEETAGTDGGGHESEHVDSAKWEDLGQFFEENTLNTALHRSGIQKCEKIDERVLEFIQLLSTDFANEMAELKEKYSEVKKKLLKLQEKLEAKKKQISPSSSSGKANKKKKDFRKSVSPSSSLGTANKTNKKRRNSDPKAGSKKRPNSGGSDDSDDGEYTFS